MNAYEYAVVRHFGKRQRGHPIRPNRRVLSAMLIALCMLIRITGQGAPSDVQTEKKGSIQLLYLDEDNAVSGAVFQVFRIGEISQYTGTSGGGYDGAASTNTVLSFLSLVPGLDLSDLHQGDGITSLRMARQLAEKYEKAVLDQLGAKAAGTSGKEAGTFSGEGYEGTTDEQGSLLVSDVPPGLYLVREAAPAKGYLQSSAFLVSVPVMGDSDWEYAVRAEPKPERAPEEETSSSEESEVTEEKSESEQGKDTVGSNTGTGTGSSKGGSSGSTSGSSGGGHVKTGDTNKIALYVWLLVGSFAGPLWLLLKVVRTLRRKLK